MAVSTVKKGQLVALNKYKEEILELLQETEAIELIGETEHEVLIQSLEYDIAQIDFAVQSIEKFSEEKISFLEKLRGGKIQITKQEMEKTVEAFDYKTITEDLTEIDSKLTEARNIINKATEEIEILTPWTELATPPVEFGETQMTGVLLGIFSLPDYEEFKLKVADFAQEIEVNIVSKNEKFAHLMLVYSQSVAEKLKDILNETNFETTQLPHEEKLPKDVITNLKESIDASEKTTAELEGKIKNYAKDCHNLKVVHDFLAWQKNQKEAERYIEHTQKTFIVRFWVEGKKYKWLEKELGKITDNFVLSEVEVEEDEVIPVPLANTALFTPFESVTNIYGVPKNNEPDPTPFLAPFFVVYFGLALTDAAYGIILAIGAYLAIKILRIPKKSQKLFKVLIWGGISTFIFGALFGGWFGMNIKEMGGPLGNIFRSVQVIDSLADPITVLLITMALGLFQVMVGIGIKGWWQIKQKNVKDAILDSGTWLFFLTSVALWVLAMAGIFPESTKKIFLYLIYAAVAGLILTQGREKKNPVMKILSGIASLYGLVGYFSDVLSYSRLLALGLATAIIASVVNMVAFLFKDMVPWEPVGWIVAVVILVGGHLFNIAINVLGAYIHSGRLQFVEFFPKFMEGGGRRFRPFARESKYVQLID